MYRFGITIDMLYGPNFMVHLIFKVGLAGQSIASSNEVTLNSSHYLQLETYSLCRVQTDIAGV